MSALFKATNTASTTTENGCVAHSSTLNSSLDLFSQIGAARGRLELIEPLFLKSLGDNEKLTTQILLWVRDIRGGQGERDLFRSLVPYIANKENIDKLIVKILEIGRTDDLFVFINTKFELNVLRAIAKELNEGNSLVAKWIPRKKEIFNKLFKYMKLSPKELRVKLVTLSNTVEQKMSSGNWDEISYKGVPSRASMIYSKAFEKNDKERYEQYKEDLSNGDTKINSSTLYPYDIVLKSLKNNFKEDIVLEKQWESLPNYLEESKFNILPVIDVSASMKSKIPETSLRCIDVAVSLGLYVAERNNSIFKDEFITFHTSPKMEKVGGKLCNKIKTIYSSEWGGSTNIEKTFKLILGAALRNNLKQDDLPSHLLIFSDMQFNRIDGCRNAAFDWAKNEFSNHGYKLPNVVFWNLRATSNYPVQDSTTGTSLVSGFSPSLLKTVLSGEIEEEPTPLEIMLETVDIERYTI